MNAFFNTLILLTISGSLLTLLIQLIKPLFIKKLPACLQKILLIAVMIFFVLPFWKLIPNIQPKFVNMDFSYLSDSAFEDEESYHTSNINGKEYLYPYGKNEVKLDSAKIIALIYFFGVVLFILSAVLSYIIFVRKKKKGSIEISYNKIFEEVKKELSIKRKIRLRVSADTHSPLLVGGFFPVIYIPQNISDEKKEKMIYLHELTHFKKGDLIFKWFVLLVNAVHWFNPFCYILSSNISDVCELSCDMSVIKKLNSEEKTFYMNTIIDLIEKERKK